MSEWSRARLGDLCSFQNGLWKGKKPPYVHVGVLRNTNFEKGGSLNLLPEQIAFLDVEERQFAKRSLLPGDIILEKSGGGPKQPVGRVALFEGSPDQFSLSNFTTRCRVAEPELLDPSFLHRFLHHCYISGRTESMQSHSTGIRNLKLDLYKEIEVPLPPLDEQRRIVAKLDEITQSGAELIENRLSKGRLLGALLEATARKAVRPSVDRDTADGWLSVSMGDLCDLYQPETISKKDLVEDGPYTVFGANGEIGRYDRFNHEDAEVLITCRGATCGTVNVSKPKSWITGNSMVVKPRDSAVSKAYLVYALRYSVDLESAITGAAQPQITRKSLAPLSISVPRNYTDQQSIVAELDRLSVFVSRASHSTEQTLQAVSSLVGTAMSNMLAA